MPYRTNSELPKSVTHVLPQHAQAMYREAFNNAYEEYRDPKERRNNATQEEVAHRVAWAAVKQKYKKGADNKWHEK